MDKYDHENGAVNGISRCTEAEQTIAEFPGSTRAKESFDGSAPILIELET
jgi:hypothetical protein